MLQRFKEKQKSCISLSRKHGPVAATGVHLLQPPSSGPLLLSRSSRSLSYSCWLHCLQGELSTVLDLKPSAQRGRRHLTSFPNTMTVGTPLGSSVTRGACGSALAPKTLQPSCPATPRVSGMLRQLYTSIASTAPALALLTTALVGKTATVSDSFRKGASNSDAHEELQQV